MGNIYGFSTINIAASGATDGNVGCFFKRDPKLVQRYRVQVPSEANDGHVTYDCVDDDLQTQCLEGTPLSCRAWAFQERFLAPKTLHFGATQLFWECKELEACEAFPDGLPAVLNKRIGFWNEENPFKFWCKVVRRYSGGLLTRESDKIIALSGVAHWFQERCGDEYLAGLWKQELLSQLLWRTTQCPDTGGGLGSRYKTYVAPSWSWTSMEALISVEDIFPLNRQACVTILDAHVTPLGGDQFGQVVDGWLRVSCDGLVPIITTTNLKYNDDQPHKKEQQHIVVNLKDFLKLFPTRRVWIDGDAPVDGTKLYSLALYETNSAPVGSSVIWGLLLKQTGNKRGQYERVGIFEFSGISFQEYKAVQAAARLSTDEFDYEIIDDLDDKRRKEFAICII